MGGVGISSRINDVWYSTDGINWTEATPSADWSGRTGHTSVANSSKIWIFGGWGTGIYYNDVWFSQ